MGPRRGQPLQPQRTPRAAAERLPAADLPEPAVRGAAGLLRAALEPGREPVAVAHPRRAASGTPGAAPVAPAADDTAAVLDAELLRLPQPHVGELVPVGTPSAQGRLPVGDAPV